MIAGSLPSERQLFAVSVSKAVIPVPASSGCWGALGQYQRRVKLGPKVEAPDRITFDLDPGENVAWTGFIEGANEVRERLRAMRLESFVKTTGGKGLHVVVPITAKADWETVKTVRPRDR